MTQNMGASADADRAGHEPSQSSLSRPVGDHPIARFTPGPWGYEPQDTLDAQIWPFAVTSDEWTVAEVYGDVAKIPAEANARLIAAAPELYEALAEARGFVAFYPAEEGLDRRGKDLMLAEIDAALAKARGQ